MRVLAGNLSGKNIRLAICEVNADKIIRVAEDNQPVHPQTSFIEVVRTFAAAHDSDVRAVGFGLPGPVRGRRAQLTNLPWVVDADEIERSLGLPSVQILNDREANAHGLRTLAPADFAVVREGSSDAAGNAGLITAGAGLGQAGMHRVKGKLLPFATEGGHTDFAASSALEFELREFLRARHGAHVSWERCVSGPGLVSIYEFFRGRSSDAEPQWLRDELDASDPVGAVINAAREDKDGVCSEAVALFLSLLGAEAGNFALKVLPTSGLYIGGWVAPMIAPLVEKSELVERFDAKGRMRSLLEQITIRIVLNARAGLNGAALYAASHAEP